MYPSIDEYIHSFPEEVQQLLQEVRRTIQAAAPQACEKISYGIPTFAWRGNQVHFAAFKKHIGFYPGPEAIRRFQEDVSGYKTSKGTIQFPLDRPLALDLIRQIVVFRLGPS